MWQGTLNIITDYILRSMAANHPSRLQNNQKEHYFAFHKTALLGATFLPKSMPFW
jgi:hypothetical protein